MDVIAITFCRCYSNELIYLYKETGYLHTIVNELTHSLCKKGKYKHSVTRQATPVGEVDSVTCWILNNNTLNLPYTPNTQEVRRHLFKFDFIITIPVI